MENIQIILSVIAAVFAILATMSKNYLMVMIHTLLFMVAIVTSYYLSNEMTMVYINLIAAGIVLASIALILLNREDLRPLMIKISFVPILVVLYLSGLNVVALLGVLGFSLSSLAAFRATVLDMKMWSLYSLFVWMSINIILGLWHLVGLNLITIAILLKVIFELRNQEM